MIASGFLLLVALVAAWSGAETVANAKSTFHEISGLLWFVLAAVCFSACVINETLRGIRKELRKAAKLAAVRQVSAAPANDPAVDALNRQ